LDFLIEGNKANEGFLAYARAVIAHDSLDSLGVGSHYSRKWISSDIVELDYDSAKEIFYEEDEKFWDEEQELMKDYEHDPVLERSAYDERQKGAVVFVRGAGTAL
jgi:hypothetical protein